MSIKTAQTLVSEAMQDIKTISTDEAHKLLEENNCNLIDIRDANELEKTGKIEKSTNVPRGLLEFQFDPNSSLIQNGIIDPNKETVLFCAAGGRSALATKTLKEMGYEKVCHIGGGFSALKNSKFKIIK
tara:strand:+ start:1198 stop:1584 length:387 start_codon:yes stop_codon:yes gene_type:complete